MKKIFLWVSLLSPALFFAMEEKQLLTPYNSINGQPITSANIGTLLPEIPQELQQKASILLTERQFPIQVLTGVFVPMNYTTLQNRTLLAKLSNDLSNEMIGAQNPSNLIMPLGYDHKIKMAGTLNKVRSLLLSAQEVGYRWDNWNEADYDAINPQTPTYQTISYAGYYYLLTKAIKEHNLDKISAPRTYFAHRPGTPQEYNDDNYAVVQETVKNVVNLATLPNDDKKQIVASFDDAMLDQQHKATRLALLWDIASNVLINPQNPTTIHIADLEQPNNSKSHLFFYQGDGKRWWDAKTGLETMQKLYDTHGSTHQQNQWKQLTAVWNQQEENLPYQ